MAKSNKSRKNHRATARIVRASSVVRKPLLLGNCLPAWLLQCFPFSRGLHPKKEGWGRNFRGARQMKYPHYSHTHTSIIHFAQAASQIKTCKSTITTRKSGSYTYAPLSAMAPTAPAPQSQRFCSGRQPVDKCHCDAIQAALQPN